MFTINALTRIAAALGVALAAAGSAQATGNTVEPGFPAKFEIPVDDSLGKPVIGFGAEGNVRRTPVIFLHGNDDTPYPTGCQRTSVRIDRVAQYFADNGYSTSELWALGYQGDQCDQIEGWSKSSGKDHSIDANVKDLRAFVEAVLRFTGAREVDIVAHGMGVILAREWVRQDDAGNFVRRFVAVDGPNGGMLICSPARGNPWASGFAGGFTPDSPVCQELGSPNTPLLQKLDSARKNSRISPSNTLVVRNGDSSYLFMPWNDGYVSGVPASDTNGTSALDSYGVPTDFTSSASVRGGSEMTLTGQHQYDSNTLQYAAHIGIANSPITWQAALDFLMKRK